jgi:hypothetical protein
VISDERCGFTLEKSDKHFSPLIAERTKAGELKIPPARHSLASGNGASVVGAVSRVRALTPRRLPTRGQGTLPEMQK